MFREISQRMMVKLKIHILTFFRTKYIFKDVYSYLSRLHYKTFHRLKYYFHEFTEYYNSNIRKSFHQSSNVGIEDGIFSPP